MPPLYPLGQHHDSLLPNAGFIENFRIEELQEHPGDWCIRGDITIKEDLDWSKGGGFSYSNTEILKRQKDGVGALYIPYPFYREPAAVDEILSYDSRLHAGQWIKKAMDPAQGVLMVCLFLLTPVWKSVWDENAWPFVKRVWAKYREGRFKNMPLDFAFMATAPSGKTVNILFIPDRRKIEQTFTKELAEAGLQKAMEIINENSRTDVNAVAQIKLYYDDEADGYRVHSIQYVDGNVKYEIE